MISIREIEKKDMEEVLLLMKGLAKHEGHESSMKFTLEKMEEVCFGDKKFHHILVVEDTDRNILVGYASYMFRFSAWGNSEFLYLDDIYVKNSERGKNIGKKLMKVLADVALKKDIPMRWICDEDNTSGLEFYKNIKADINNKFDCRWPQQKMQGFMS